MEIIVNNRFSVGFVIGRGGSSDVYLGTDLENGRREVALKTCPLKIKDAVRFLIDEASVLAAIDEAKGIPTRYWSGHDCEYYVTAQELLGPTLGDLLKYCGSFSLKTTLLIADQAIERLEFIHSKGYVHGDIKPANMAMGLGEQGNVLYFFDFGIARKFGFDEEWMSRHGKKPFFTGLYASSNMIDEKGWSWADDLESLGYALIEFCGKFSWFINCWKKDPVIHKKCRGVGLLRRCRLQRPSVQEMCEGLPDEFLKYFEHIRSIAHGQKPDYGHLRELFRGAFRNRDYQDDNLYDWTLKLFDDVHDIKSTPNEQPEPTEVQATSAEETRTEAKSG